MLLPNGFLAMSFHQERKIENNRSSNHKLVLLKQCDLNSFSFSVLWKALWPVQIVSQQRLYTVL